MARRVDGKAVWLELQTQRPAEAELFYTGCFGWKTTPTHASSWGTVPVFRHGNRALGSVFHTVTPFHVSRWGVFFSGDPDEAAARADRSGGGVISPPETSPGWGRTTELFDPSGHPFSVIALDSDDPPDPARPGEPLLIELRAPEAVSLASFYASVLGLEIRALGELAFLGTRAWPRILLRNDPAAPPHHPWIPWFRSLAVPADSVRAERFGAIVQLPRHDVPGFGHGAVLADPSGAFFGFGRPEE